jgi:PAS domain S-box-containing protein
MPSSILSGKFLLGFLESYPAAVSVFKPDGTMVFVNQNGCELLKKSKKELIGKRVQDFVADRTMAESIISRIISKGYVETELSVTQSNGDTLGIRLTGVLVRNGTGESVGVVGMARVTATALGKSTDQSAPRSQNAYRRGSRQRAKGKPRDSPPLGQKRAIALRQAAPRHPNTKRSS